MGFFDFFKRATTAKTHEPTLKIVWTGEGAWVEFARDLPEPTAEALLEAIHTAGPEDTVLGAYLAQLAAEERCVLEESGALIPWLDLYELQGAVEHVGALRLLALPPQGPLRPILDCSGSLSSPEFELDVVGWTDGIRQIQPDGLIGAIATIDNEQQMLAAAAWATVSEVARFRTRSPNERNQHFHELAWGRIRRVADQAGALFANPYLETTFVLTPETLRLPLLKDETPFGRVLTVSPTFDGAPDGWLTAFDGFNSVQLHYDLTRGAGRVRVVISEPVRKVLEVIKREMPGRKVAGSKAQKFVHNPFAFLGETAYEVLKEDEFERDRADAGPVAALFSIVGRFDAGRITVVDLLVTEHYGDGGARTDVTGFNTPEQLDEFLVRLKNALELEREFLPWDEFDLTLDAESTLQLEQGLLLCHMWRTQPDERIDFEDVYQLDGYSSRIEGIGAVKPIYVPVFQKDKKEAEGDEGWLPSDLTPMVKVTLQGHEGDVLIPLTKEWAQEFDKQVSEAEATGQPEVRNGSLPTAIATPQARTLADSFLSMVGAQDQIKGEKGRQTREAKKAKQTLLVKTNFHGVDYFEERRASLALPVDWMTQLPRCLSSGIELKKHQLHGVAWFQHLVSKAPAECRGALLADDMGLGKTLQLLSLLAWYYEINPSAAPSIVVAPKSLLENWENETRKFFTPSFPETLVLYGESLQERKQPRALIDSQLQQVGIVDLLKPGWAGSAKVIVTTYEVLTSYEFSLAKQPFALVIYDEAQRIKTPGTLVTLAAKKLKADFRVACTGTPVENSLADLWCLFDLVQPGLLGALEEFGKVYRRPIECDTDEQKEALTRLQAAIAPQTLRRTKAGIASELPTKYFATQHLGQQSLEFKPVLDDGERLEIAMSEHQRILYKGGLKKLKDAVAESNGRRRAALSFGALHLMKAVCAEPYCLPGSKFLVDQSGRKVHLENSPKLRWLLERLEDVEKAGEKAIVFTELREVQAALYYFLKEAFGIRPFIINGESQGRQRYIDKFSERPGFDVIILSTLAAGAGLNVTAANHVFHFTRAWNPSKESQATDRAFRIGQERDVFVYCPTVVAEDFCTFEARLDQLLKQKAILAGSTLNDGELAAMLNGTGKDASFTELVGDGNDGEMVPKRYLTMDDVDRMDGDGFEAFCCLLWHKQGFQASVTPKQRGDGGIDVVALRGREGVLLQCKSSKSSDLGWDAIKEVTAGAAIYQARFRRTRFTKIAVTNQQFTSGAVEQAKANHVELVTRPQLEELLARHPVSNHEFDEALQEEMLSPN
ncbi:SNF2-related protein [Paraburkholderia caballeronis]|uniref:Superfamily II DNA or RNA helicase, SNF2 family n=1 Tax=Paraburkholderia caballeronis TaxID=416943 RepID=A0A1H7SK46_9BURK|nr:SNF2-related protein [Paraburkholderia caballeronis]PXW22304.1 SNF2 family DNA or RNA helicase [Paraburkholderia caballeronis]PXW95963.1 SNF2 family DNA or RNA helicase [Paraburkholderia caballeronis]RAJ92329.1 SNF2 family DNA or RNA helicase [Paraburkholderia caballeronis]TDV27881.1 SNF2 family DNA or RNA helicase [Paraburkholderia caballeronis]SEB52406.1 Superfamily II DNA or RNA helicase, SNF2 family [Paraburkholderia caballeronis]